MFSEFPPLSPNALFCFWSGIEESFGRAALSVKGVKQKHLQGQPMDCIFCKFVHEQRLTRSPHEISSTEKTPMHDSLHLGVASESWSLDEHPFKKCLVALARWTSKSSHFLEQPCSEIKTG